MNSHPRELLHAYVSRRSPWGPPWWIYAAAFGVANVARHVLVIVDPAAVPQPVRVGMFAASALVVIAVVNTVAVVLQRRGGTARRGAAGALAPVWPLRRAVVLDKPDAALAHPDRGTTPTTPGTHSTPPTTATAMRTDGRTPSTTSEKWAPWWVYLGVIIGTNALRQFVLPDFGTPATRVVTAVAVAVVLVVAITIVHRTTVRNDDTGASSYGCTRC